MKKILLTLGIMVFSLVAFGQQDSHYSMYMFNGFVLNPAYAGSRDHASAVLLHRQQWLGLDGAPRNTSFSINTPTANLRHGLGLTFVNDRIGPIGKSDMAVAYAFRILTGENSALALGLNAQLTNYRTFFNDLNLVTTDPATGAPVNVSDPSFSGNELNTWLPNFGTGIYFNSQRFYIGASMPRILSQQLNDDDINNGVSTAQQRPLFFATTGVVVDFGSAVKFKPSVLTKKTAGTDFEFDFNASFLFKEKLWLGASYRTEDALVFLAEFQPTPALRFGYAYDMTLTGLNAYNSGSHEFMLGFDFSFRRADMTSPRLF